MSGRYNHTTGREWRPHRRNAAGLKCARCEVIFAAGRVPKPHRGGRYDGGLLCSACRGGLEPPQPAHPSLF